MLSLITEFVLRLAYWRKPPSFSAPSKAHSSQLLLPHSHPRRLSESSCTETTCSFSTVCITLPQKRDKVNRNSSCLIRFLQKSLTISCQLFYTTPTFFIPHQRSAAPVSAPASVGAGRSPPGSSTRGSRRDQVLLPLPFEIWLDSWISRFQAIFFTL